MEILRVPDLGTDWD